MNATKDRTVTPSKPKPRHTPSEAELVAYRAGWHRSKHAHEKARLNTLEAARAAYSKHHTKPEIESFEKGWMDWTADNEWGTSLTLWFVEWTDNDGVGKRSRSATLTKYEAEEQAELTRAMGHENARAVRRDV